MKPGGTIQLHGKPEPAIRWRGKRFPIGVAYALAAQQLQLGNFQVALEIYDLILAKVPGFAEGFNNRGVILQMLNRFGEALASYDKAIALKPDYANAHFNRGTTLKKMSRQDESLASYDRAIALKPDHAEAYNNRGVLLQEMRRYDEALASYDKAIALNPRHAEAHNNKGIVLMSIGNMPEAERMFAKASELKPDFPDPLFNLSIIRRHGDMDAAEVKSIQTLLVKPGIASNEKEQLYFALGKIYDDCGRYDEAFECFRQANQIRNAGVKYAAALVEKMTSGIIEVFGKDFLSHPFAHASESQSPIFIIGMPRSGTTLLASILSNHPAVGMAGELPTIPDLALHLGEWVGGGEVYPAASRHIPPAVATRLIAEYEQRLRRDVGSDKAYVIDKNPLNFSHLGLISHLFPNARIIHCLRHPLDTCLSIYFQRFPLRLDFAFDLRNIGHFYREYARLMDHWRMVPTLKMMEVSYEDTVLRTEQTARAMLDFLGLEWDPRCLAPHTNPSPVETASQWQVRQPIYQQALGRWRHYEKHLAPLQEWLPAGAFS
jgi:tetratricopeptide (TPR) repeat protein